MYFYHLPNCMFENSRTCCPKLKNQKKIFPKILRCLTQKNFKQYTTRVEQVELATESVKQTLNNVTEDMNAQFSMMFASNDTDIFEEILIVDEISLIGSLGGSLGLFIGFSFFGYITSFFDVIVEKLFYTSIQRN